MSFKESYTKHLFVSEKKKLICFVVMLFSIAVATGIRLLLSPLLENHQPFLTYFIAVIIVAWLCGFWFAILAMLLSIAAASVLFFELQSSLELLDAGDIFHTILFLVVGITFSLISESMHRTRRQLETDVSERKLAEEKARTAEEKLRLIMDSVPALISYVDKNKYYRLHNQAYANWFGNSGNTITGKHVSRVVGEAAWEKIRPRLEATLAGEEITYEDLIPYKDVGERWVNVTYTPHRDEKGEIQGLIVMVVDVTERKLAEQEIREWRDHYEIVVKASGMILYDVSFSGDKLVFGGSITEITGYRTEEFNNGISNWIEKIHPEDRAAFLAAMKSIRSKGMETLEYRLKRADGVYINVLDRGYTLLNEEGEITRILGLIEDITVIKRAENERKVLAGRIEKARGDERRYLARQLHDDIGQQFAAASIKLGQLESRLVELLPEENALLSELVKVEELLKRNQQALRNLAHILHPSVLEQFGLAEGLRRFLRNIGGISQKSSPNISLEIAPDFPRFDLTIETGIYRIVQEAVTNALKHSAAKSISLSLKTDNNSALIIIHDDGCGFDSEEKRSKGIGLASMRERAANIGAKLNLTSKKEEGTTVTLSLPLKKSRRRNTSSK